jgi:regulating synaptic membrane exocytosis protein 2
MLILIAGVLLQHPLSWQASTDGSRLIGHMILKKEGLDGGGYSASSAAAILGLKVVGGQPLPHGGRGALIDKVKRGSTAEREGGLIPGETP